tara:strand:- start:731 stop:1450 length:720 start_codon:yes stop_codon:yes gene_type:complete
MIINSYQESTIDYPGKYGPIIFTQGCDFRCGFCHNPELAPMQDEGVKNEILMNEIKRKAKRGWYNSVVISGGEPTLQKDLPEFVDKLKSYDLAVKLDSNGSNPEILERLLDEGNVDYVAMDIKAPRDRYGEIMMSMSNRLKPMINLKDIDKSIGLVKQFPMYEFRTTVLPFFSRTNLEHIGEWVMGRGEKVKLYTLQQFNPDKCFDKEYEALEPESKEEIESYEEIMKKYAEEVRVLGL